MKCPTGVGCFFHNEKAALAGVMTHRSKVDMPLFSERDGTLGHSDVTTVWSLCSRPAPGVVT